MVNEDDCTNKPVGEDYSVGKRCSAEDSTDKFRWDELSLLVTLNPVGGLNSCL